MKIFTSYFDNIENCNGLVLIGIAGISPPGFNGLEYKKLAPKRFIYDNYIESGDEEEYSRNYFGYVLDKLNPREVIKELEELSKGKNLVLLCYEKPNQFCHRQLVRYWMKSALNLEIKEICDKKKIF